MDGILVIYQNFYFYLEVIWRFYSSLFPDIVAICSFFFLVILRVFYFVGKKKIKNQVTAIIFHACAILRQINSSLNVVPHAVLNFWCSYILHWILLAIKDDFPIISYQFPFYIVFTIFINHGLRNISVIQNSICSQYICSKSFICCV